MTELERYEFDRVGYLVIPRLLTTEEVSSLATAIDELEAHALEHIGSPPRVVSPWFTSMEYHRDESLGYHAYLSPGESNTLMVEDFWNADAAFHMLIDHAPTMDYIKTIVQERFAINNSELRIRYTGNRTGAHLGGPVSSKYRYRFTNSEIDCMMVRMVYFVHDVDFERGPFCVVPASHKSNYLSPYQCDPEEEPGMIGLEAKAGDAILFTENLRHGGFINRSPQPRKTMHVGYGPAWMQSQNIATADQPPYITAATRARLTTAQNNLFRAYPE